MKTDEPCPISETEHVETRPCKLSPCRLKSKWRLPSRNRAPKRWSDNSIDVDQNKFNVLKKHRVHDGKSPIFVANPRKPRSNYSTYYPMYPQIKRLSPIIHVNPPGKDLRTCFPFLFTLTDRTLRPLRLANNSATFPLRRNGCHNLRENIHNKSYFTYTNSEAVLHSIYRVLHIQLYTYTTTHIAVKIE